MANWPGFLAAALLAGCAAQQAPAASPSSPEAKALAHLGTGIAGLQRDGSPDVDGSPGVLSGATQRLVAPDTAITLYLFRRSAAPVADGFASLPVMLELQGSAQAMVLSMEAEAGRTTPIQPVSMGVGLRGQPPAIRCMASGQPLSGAIRTEVVCVTGTGGRLLKLRQTTTATHQSSDSTGVQAAATAAAIGAGSILLRVKLELDGRLPAVSTDEVRG